MEFYADHESTDRPTPWVSGVMRHTIGNPRHAGSILGKCFSNRSRVFTGTVSCVPVRLQSLIARLTESGLRAQY